MILMSIRARYLIHDLFTQLEWYLPDFRQRFSFSWNPEKRAEQTFLVSQQFVDTVQSYTTVVTNDTATTVRIWQTSQITPDLRQARIAAVYTSNTPCIVGLAVLR